MKRVATSPLTVRNPSIVLSVVAGNNASIRNVFSLDGHGGLFSFAGTVCHVCGVRGLLLLHHAQAAGGRLGTVGVSALKFGAGGEDKANTLALREKIVSQVTNRPGNVSDVQGPTKALTIGVS